METLHHIWNSIPWATVRDAVIAAGGVSVAVQVFKKWLALQSEKVITFLVGVVSFIAVGINYLMGAAAQNPMILGQRTAALVGLATLIYQAPGIGIKTLSGILRDAKTLREAQTTQVSVPPVPAAPAASESAEFQG